MCTICTVISEVKSDGMEGMSGTIILAKVPPLAFLVSLPGLTQVQPSTRCGMEKQRVCSNRFSFTSKNLILNFHIRFLPGNEADILGG